MKIEYWLIILAVISPFIYAGMRFLCSTCIHWEWIKYFSFGATAWFTLYLAFIGLITLIVQTNGINDQLKMQTISKLYEEWNAPSMCEYRSKSAKAILENNLDINSNRDKIETVLEFLERICSYTGKGILDKDWLWDNFGFYIERYYYYNRNNIKDIRIIWDDSTLYKDTENVYPELIKDELRHIGKNPDSKEEMLIFEKNLDRTKKLFLDSEMFGIK